MRISPHFGDPQGLNMNIDIQSIRVPMTIALSDHAARRLGFVMSRHADRIQRVVVRFGEASRRRVGADKFCRIRVYLFDAPVAVIADVGADLYAVIDRATDRVGRVVVKHLDRSRFGRRRGPEDATTSSHGAFDAKPYATHSAGERA